MSQQAVMAFLSHWYKRQEAGKTWPLKFLKPQRQVFQEDEDPADGRDGGGEGFTAEDDDHDEGDGDEEHLKSQTRRAAKGKGVAKHGRASRAKKNEGGVEGFNGDGGSEGEPTADGYHDGGDSDDEEEEDAVSRGRQGANGKGKSVNEGVGGKEDIIEVPTTPAQVEPPLRKLFLKSLSSDKGYKMLVKLLDTANVSFGVLI